MDTSRSSMCNAVSTIGIVLLVCALSMAVYVSLSDSGDSDVLAAQHESALPSKAIAALTGTEGNDVHGTVTFTQQADGVLIEAHIIGLSPGKHGFHIHEFGDITSADGKSTGGHFNPEGNDHAGPDADKRHVGDLGNIEVDANGHGMYKNVDKVVQIHGRHTILGRSHFYVHHD